MFVFKLAPVPSRKMIIWSPNCTFVVVLRWNENGNPSLYLCVLLVMATHKKYYIKEKKIWIVEVVFFRYKWREFSHLEQQRYEIIGSLRYHNGDGPENVSQKVNSRSLYLYRDYVNSLTLPNASELSWSRIPNNHIKFRAERERKFRRRL